MRTKPIIAGAVVIAVLLLGSSLFIVTRPSAPAITVRHIKSIRSGNITTMTFEIKNHTGNLYIFTPFEVQVRNGNAWKFQGFDPIYPIPTVNPMGATSYTVSVTNLPNASVLRVLIRPKKMLLGFNGFVRRAELNLENRAAGGRGLSLNPSDKHALIFGLPIEVVSEEWVEAGSK